MRAKRISAILLVAALLAGLALPVSVGAADKPAPYKNPTGCAPAKPCKYSPVIVLPGIGQTDTNVYQNGEFLTSGSSLMLDADSLLSFGTLAPLILSLLASVVTQRDIGLTRQLYNLTAKLVDLSRVGPDAKPFYEMRADTLGVEPATGIVRLSDMQTGEGARTDKARFLDVQLPAYGMIDLAGEDHVFFYPFNFIGDIWDTIDKLEDCIDQVRKLTGHKKVTLCGISLGGTLVTGYLDKYGHKKLDQIINIVSTSDGTSLLADIFDLDVSDDPAVLFGDTLPDLVEGLKIMEGYDRALGYGAGFLLRLLPADLFAKVLDAAFLGLFDTALRNSTQIWSLIPRERYPALAERYLSGSEHKVVRGKTDAYYKAQVNLAKNILNAKKDGVHINSIAGAGLVQMSDITDDGPVPLIPLYPLLTRERRNSDGVVDLAGATMGATCASPGQKLPAGYKPKKAGHMSPDGSIDCSTAVLPDNTWVFTDQHHEVARNDAVLHLLTALVRNPGMTVKTDPKKYPQFNPGMDTKVLRRNNIIPDAEKLIASGDMSAADKKALQAMVKEGKAVRALTVGDPARAKKATADILDMLVKYEVRQARQPVPEPSALQAGLTDVLAFLSRGALSFYGDRGYFEPGNLIRFGKKAAAELWG